MKRALFLVPILATAAFASAQTSSRFVVPVGYATKPGNAMEQQVFGFQQSRYVQYVDKAELTGLPSAAKIKELWYRREENRLDRIYSNYEPMRKNTAYPLPNWQIRLGNFAGDYANLQPIYYSSANKVSMTTVFAAQLNLTVNNPTLYPPANASKPAPFKMRFPFNVAQFTYTGKGLCVDHKVYSTRNYAHVYFVDSFVSRPSQGGSVSLISPTSLGCPANMNRLYGTAPNPGAGSVKLHLFGAPKNARAIAWLGGQTSSWNGAPLPLGLGILGLKGCNIYTDWTFPVFTTTDGAGIGSISIPVPGNSAYAGTSVFSQWAIADPRVNPSTGFAVSDGVRVKIGTTVGAGLVRSSVISAIGGQSRSSAGYVQYHRGSIFQLVY